MSLDFGKRHAIKQHVGRAMASLSTMTRVWINVEVKGTTKAGDSHLLDAWDIVVDSENGLYVVLIDPARRHDAIAQHVLGLMCATFNMCNGYYMDADDRVDVVLPMHGGTLHLSKISLTGTPIVLGTDEQQPRDTRMRDTLHPSIMGLFVLQSPIAAAAMARPENGLSVTELTSGQSPRIPFPQLFGPECSDMIGPMRMYEVYYSA